jgi:hypothetical protein
MKIKDLLHLNPEANILITLQHEMGSTTFDLEKCKHIEFQDMLNDDAYVEFRCVVHKLEKKGKRNPEDDIQWEDALKSPSWGNYSGID